MAGKPTPLKDRESRPLTTTADVEVSEPDLMLALSGPGEQNLRVLEEEFGIEIGLRGETIRLQGPTEAVAIAERVLTELLDVITRGKHLTDVEVQRAARTLRDHPEVKLRNLFEDVVLHVQSRRRVIAPKGVAQQLYIQSIRDADIVFGIGPAGTGKTYLAMAMAVRELMEKRVKRIVLTRPAVEAGEKLGFLPGDLAEKVNPYLRPLYDALNDMMDLDKAQALIQRGSIEVAPLAFMRGRAGTVFSRVLTPSGWRPMGSLRVGDSVIGSNGRPTRVLGVYPQGRKDVYRFTAQDGASTLCCGEHLWAVYTASDRRRGKPARVLETREMIGKLRVHHQRRYELPLLSEPVRLAARDVPMDPYALGLLLGDGCLTGATTPTFATADAEPVLALERELDGIELVHKSAYDYTLRNVAGGRGGVIVSNPVTVTLRDLGICGTRSHTKFVPEVYLWNSASTRLALLQGLLDTDGGPVTQAGRTCRVQYTTTSERLRDDVIFLVRSLGGVAYSRTRKAEGRKPGFARGREIGYNHDAFVLDIRLPEGMMPFRLPRKRDAFVEAGGGGRPTRFIESIEPAGTEETLCIRVEAEDSLYVTDDFLVTHNTLNDSFVILDEAQNTTPEQMKMFLTRLGFESKAVITGDVTQVDLPEGRRSGLNDAVELLNGVDGLRFVYFTDADVVRHPLVQKIVRAYDDRDARLKGGR
jgi:phosphate starvation-inducible PhoH-like protein